MKTIGITDPKWSLKEAIKRQVEVEDRVVFANQPTATIERNYTYSKFPLSDTAKYVLGSSVHFIKAFPKL